MSRQLDDKIQIINQIQSSFRRKKLGYETFLQINSLELPPIANVMVTFPVSPPNRRKCTSIHSPKKNIAEKQLQNIVSFNSVDLKNITNKEANKIINSRHLKNNNLILQRTGFRTSLNFTGDQKIGKNSYHSLSIEKKQRKQKQEQFLVAYEPIQLSRFNCQCQKTTMNKFLTVKQSPQIKRVTNYGIFDIFPEYRQARMNKIERIKYDPKPFKRNDIHFQRYSPWRINQQQEQLII